MTGNEPEDGAAYLDGIQHYAGVLVIFRRRSLGRTLSYYQHSSFVAERLVGVTAVGQCLLWPVADICRSTPFLESSTKELDPSQPIAGVDPASITADSPVPFSLNQLWHDLYCREFGTYLSAGGANPSDQVTWAYECDLSGAKIVGGAQAAVPPRFRKVKNVASDPEKINWLPDVLNIRGPLVCPKVPLQPSQCASPLDDRRH